MEVKKNSRFDYVRYDDLAMDQQSSFKLQFIFLETCIESLVSPRAKAIAITKLEECYMWVGKAIRDDQIERNGYEATELQEGRNNS